MTQILANDGRVWAARTTLFLVRDVGMAAPIPILRRVQLAVSGTAHTLASLSFDLRVSCVASRFAWAIETTSGELTTYELRRDTH